MIEHVWTVVCSESVIDNESNNLYLQKVIEQIVIYDNPRPDGMLSHELHVVSFWTKSDLEQSIKGEMRVAFDAPNGKRLGAFDMEIDLTITQRTRNIIKFQTLPLKEPGRHYFHIYLLTDANKKWKRVASIPVDIIFQPKDGPIADLQYQKETVQL